MKYLLLFLLVSCTDTDQIKRPYRVYSQEKGAVYCKYYQVNHNLTDCIDYAGEKVPDIHNATNYTIKGN